MKASDIFWFCFFIILLFLLVPTDVGATTGAMTPAHVAPMPARSAPAAPDSYVAPVGLDEAMIRRACPHGCTGERQAFVLETTRRLAWVGSWYVEHHDLPAYMTWWLPLHGWRESSLDHMSVGDNGNADGMFQLNGGWADLVWLRIGGSGNLDRFDFEASARVLMDQVSHSFHDIVPRVCGRQQVDRRMRLAAARVGRGPNDERGEPRCHFTVQTKTGPRDIAGIPVRNARVLFGRHKTAGARGVGSKETP